MKRKVKEMKKLDKIRLLSILDCCSTNMLKKRIILKENVKQQYYFTLIGFNSLDFF